MLAENSSAGLYALLRSSRGIGNRGLSPLVRLRFTPAWEWIVLAREASASVNALRFLLGLKNRGLSLLVRLRFTLAPRID